MNEELHDVRFTRQVSAKQDWAVCMYTARYSDSLPSEIRKNKKGNRCYFFATGNSLPETHHVNIDLRGEWRNSKYGLQFAVRSFQVSMPTRSEDIEKFLASGAIKHIGQTTAKAIVEKFGEDALRIIAEEPEKLLAIRGIGEKNLAAIKESANLTRGYQNLAGILTRFSVPPEKMNLIYKELGDDAAQLIQDNPYELMKVKGFGFLTADKIAKGLGVGLTGMNRIFAGLEHVCQTISRESGDMYAAKKDLIPRTEKLLNEGFKPKILSEEDIENGFELATVAGKLLYRFRDSLKIVYLPEYDEAEKETAQRIAFFAKKKGKDAKLETAMKEWEENASFTLTSGQRRAVYAVCKSRLSVITGGAGTGKTTITKAIIESYKEAYPNKEIYLLAPTSKAARRMKEATGLSAHTIHSALKIATGDGALEYRQKLEEGLVIVDEFSMVDNFVAQSLFRACDDESTIVLIGDVNQLPSVGPGCVLSELIRSEKVTVTRLMQIMRQGEGSPIVANSYQINDGCCELEFCDQFRFLSADRNSAADLCLSTYMQEISEFGLDEVVILSPHRDKGDVSAEALNEAIEGVLNTAGDRTWICHNTTFRIGDRVIQTKNTETASNGDVGTLVEVTNGTDAYGESEVIFVIDFDDGETVRYNRKDMNHVNLAYALTVHKSQGSEYKSVIIPLLGKSRLHKRNLLYTAVTRAKERVTIIGEASAVNRSILTEDANERKSLLANRIYILLKDEEEREED